MDVFNSYVFRKWLLDMWNETWNIAMLCYLFWILWASLLWFMLMMNIDGSLHQIWGPQTRGRNCVYASADSIGICDRTQYNLTYAESKGKCYTNPTRASKRGLPRVIFFGDMTVSMNIFKSQDVSILWWYFTNPRPLPIHINILFRSRKNWYRPIF